ncbi:MAG: hypothetical protein JNL70_10985 [Saprospiraceae bacterium]|nr:hypothetical protein [Saprospiraceae bacterium]
MLDKLRKTITEQTAQIKEAALEQATQLGDVAKEKAKETTHQFATAIRETANNVTDSIRDKTMSLVDDWLKIFPNLEHYGLIITSFGISMSISPVLEVELMGEAEDFSVEKLDLILEDVQGNNALTTVFKTVRMTYDWHRKTGGECYFDKIYLKLTVGISPQVMVYLGEPKLM